MKKPLTPFTSADYSALEVRATALTSAPPKGTTTGRIDPHTARAASMFDVPLEEVTTEQRTLAKRLNYSDWYTP